MKNILIFSIILISACTSNKSKNNMNSDIISFEKMTFDQYKKKLEYYSKNNPYPDIDG
jgi:hypothetical protein